MTRFGIRNEREVIAYLLTKAIDSPHLAEQIRHLIAKIKAAGVGILKDKDLESIGEHRLYFSRVTKRMSRTMEGTRSPRGATVTRYSSVEIFRAA